MLIRAKDPKTAEKMAKACEAGVANKNIGYDQWQRNTLRAEAKKSGWNLGAIKTPCETDCSAFMAVCAEAAGVNMDVTYTQGNAPATFQMRQQWAKTGKFEMITDKKYLTSSDYLKRGDVLVNESRHTVMVLNDGSKAEQIDEKHEANKAKVKSRFGFTDATVDWLDTYKYNKDLMEKLANKG